MVRSVIVLTLTSVLLIFAGALTLRSEASITDSADSIANNATASISALSEARTELRNFQRLFDDYVDAASEGGHPNRRRVDESLAKVERALHDYLALPSYPGERESIDGLAGSRTRIQELVNRCLAAIDARDFANALSVEKHELDPLVELLNERIVDVVQLNAREARRLALGVAELHRRTVVLTALVDLAALVALGTVSLWSVLRIRRERDSLELARRRAEEQAASLEQFSGMVAHDVLSPLTGTLLALSLAERLHPGDETLRRYTGQGRAALGQTMSLVHGLLEFARAAVQPDASEATGVVETARELVEGSRAEAEASGIELLFQASGAAVVPVSKGVLSSVLLNLIRNAVKYSGSDGEQVIWVRVSEGVATCRLEVEDTGPGVPAGLEAAIFEPYVRGPRERKPGFGIGLATVKRLVTAHGGAVGVTRGARGGALFWVELPTRVAFPALRVAE